MTSAIASSLISRLVTVAQNVSCCCRKQIHGGAACRGGCVRWALKVADRDVYQAQRAGRDRIVASVAFTERPNHA
jgi:hypothetical protein